MLLLLFILHIRAVTSTSSGLIQVFVELGSRHGTLNRGCLRPHGLNKGHGLKFCIGSQVQQTSEEGQRTYQPKYCEYIDKDEDNNSKTLVNFVVNK